MAETVRVELAFNQGFAQVDELHQTLCAVLGGERDTIVIDGRLVEQMDVSTAQLLAAFVRDARAKNRVVQWVDPSERLVRVMRLTGLSRVAGLGA